MRGGDSKTFFCLSNTSLEDGMRIGHQCVVRETKLRRVSVYALVNSVVGIQIFYLFVGKQCTATGCIWLMMCLG